MSLTLQAKKFNVAVQNPEVMDRLFRRLIAFYGTKFSDAYAGLELGSIKEIWGEELSSYSIPEINRGVEACRSLKWPPTLPEFLSACRPPINAPMAYHEATQNLVLRKDGKHPAYSHPAIYWAACDIGMWDLEHTPSRFMEARWAACLSRQLAIGSWSEVPPPPIALEAPKGHGATPEIMAQLKEITAKLRAPLPSSYTKPTVGESK